MIDKALATLIDEIDLNQIPPVEEPARQHYFMKKCKLIVEKENEKLGHKLTAFIATFG